MIAVQSLDRPTLVAPAGGATPLRFPAQAYATITLAGTITAQGPVLRRFADGRVEICTGSRALAGYPVAR